MATAIATSGADKAKEYIWAWEGRDRQGKTVRGDTRGVSEAVIRSTL